MFILERNNILVLLATGMFIVKSHTYPCIVGNRHVHSEKSHISLYCKQQAHVHSEKSHISLYCKQQAHVHSEKSHIFLYCKQQACSYWIDFSVKINGENNSENTIFIFTVCKKRAFMNSLLKVLAKKFKM